jgi:DNA-binding PucR family transcriptional regulator
VGTKGPFVALLFELDADAVLPPAVARERILSIITISCESRFPDAMCALIDGKFWSVLPINGVSETSTIAELGTNILGRVESAAGTRLAAAIGAAVEELTDIPQSRRSAEQAMAVLRRRGTKAGLVRFEEVEERIVLRELIDLAAGHEQISLGKLRQLIESDAKRGTRHIDTLRTYLDNWGSIAATASKLSLHENSVRSRLNRISEISGIDLTDPDQRLITEIQLRLLSP